MTYYPSRCNTVQTYYYTLSLFPKCKTKVKS